MPRKTFKLVPVEGQDKFWNIIHDESNRHAGYYDGINKLLTFKEDTTLSILENLELIDQVDDLDDGEHPKTPPRHP